MQEHISSLKVCMLFVYLYGFLWIKARIYNLQAPTLAKRCSHTICNFCNWFPDNGHGYVHSCLVHVAFDQTRMRKSTPINLKPITCWKTSLRAAFHQILMSRLLFSPSCTELYREFMRNRYNSMKTSSASSRF
jgi:hypothetical protein